MQKANLHSTNRKYTHLPYNISQQDCLSRSLISLIKFALGMLVISARSEAGRVLLLTSETEAGHGTMNENTIKRGYYIGDLSVIHIHVVRRSEEVLALFLEKCSRSIEGQPTPFFWSEPASKTHTNLLDNKSGDGYFDRNIKSTQNINLNGFERIRFQPTHFWNARDKKLPPLHRLLDRLDCPQPRS